MPRRRKEQQLQALALGALLLAPLSALGKASPPRRVEVQGHRGARARHPENTMEAFRYALRLGVDTLELDLHVSKDDKLVVIHDGQVSPARCLDARGQRLQRPLLIRETPAATLRGLQCGRLPHPRFPQQRRSAGHIPLFDEVAKLARSTAGRNVQLNIETKSVPGRPALAPPPKRFAELVVASLRRHGLLKRTTLQSFDYRTLAAARQLAPRLRIALLTDGQTLDYARLASRHHANIVSPHHEWITATDVRRLHQLGVRVIPWTANNLAAWKRLVGLGVDGIITDDPAALLTYLRQRGLHR